MTTSQPDCNEPGKSSGRDHATGLCTSVERTIRTLVAIVLATFALAGFAEHAFALVPHAIQPLPHGGEAAAAEPSVLGRGGGAQAPQGPSTGRGWALNRNADAREPLLPPRMSKSDNGQTTTYRYDAIGNLRSVALPSGEEIKYRVDGMNRRILRSKAGVTTDKFVWRSQLQPVLWEDKNGIQGRLVYALGRNVPEYMQKNGRLFRLISG